MLIKNQILKAVNSLSDRNKTPFYIYDIDRIRHNCNLFTSIPYKNKSIHFATMANINAEFLKVLKNEKLSVFVNSLDHLREVESAGFKGKDIVFTSSALNDNILKTISEKETQINLDSVSQVERWRTLFPNRKFGIRCNIGEYVGALKTHAGYFIGKESRLGLLPAEIQKLDCKDSINGLHIYIGTDLNDLEYFLECYRILASFIPLFPNIDYLNLGGGFGIPKNGEDHFRIREYSYRLTELMDSLSESHKKEIRLILEPGRIIAGDSGYFVSRVTDVKHRNGSQYIGVDASSTQFPRPLFYQDEATHPLMIIKYGIPQKTEKGGESFVFGCSTYSRDFLARAVILPEARIGDLLIFGNAGAYSASACTSFLGFPKPQEYFR